MGRGQPPTRVFFEGKSVRSILTPLTCALAGALLQAQSNVWVVDAASGPGTDFTSFSAAFAAAADGDIVIVKPGTYFEFLPPAVSGKGLTVVADGAVTMPPVWIQDVAAGQAFTLRGFGGTGYVNLDDCAGTVWLEELVDPTTTGFPHLDVGAWMCANVVVNRCELKGDAVDVGLTPGLRLTASSASIWNSTLTGGPSNPFGPPGDPGLELTDSFLFASGSSFVGGDPGGLAALQEGASQSIFVDCTGALTVNGGTHAVWSGTKRSFEASALTREGQSVTMRWDGAPGELAILNLSTTPGGLLLPSFSGFATLGFPILWITGAGTLAADGTHSIALQVPELGAGVEGVVLYAQGSFADFATSTVRIGGGSVITLLDQAF